MGFDWYDWTLIAVHGVVTFVLYTYALNWYILLGVYFKHRRRKIPTVSLPPDSELPVVTVQLPMFNEKWVARRIIQAVCAFDYPREKLEIQVLDDSTDETTRIVEEEIARQKEKGIELTLIHRTDRTGYKGGALANGLRQARGEYIAIFDADFIPSSDWVRRALPPLLADPTIGWVQTRWGHLNATECFLTRAQAMGLNGHFAVEQPSRVAGKFFPNFNGTAGIWRRRAIDEAGGWTGDTLTEDLDLSYRAHLKGWRMEFLPDVEVPAELLTEMSAFKAQQFRWAKGSIQTARKVLPLLWRSTEPLWRKLIGTLHLTSYFLQPLMLFSILLAFPMLRLVNRVPDWVVYAGMTFFGIAFIAPLVVYAVAHFKLHGGWTRLFWILPTVIGLGMGVALGNTRAILQAMLDEPSPFVRTPKRGDRKGRSGYKSPFTFDFAGELVLSLYCGVAACFYSIYECYPLAVILGVYSIGFFTVAMLALQDALARPPASQGAPAETRLLDTGTLAQR